MHLGQRYRVRDLNEVNVHEKDAELDKLQILLQMACISGPPSAEEPWSRPDCPRRRLEG